MDAIKTNDASNLRISSNHNKPTRLYVANHNTSRRIEVTKITPAEPFDEQVENWSLFDADETEPVASFPTQNRRAKILARARAKTQKREMPSNLIPFIAPESANAPAIYGANDTLGIGEMDFVSLHAIREQLYTIDDVVEERPSNAMRLAAHTMNATLIVVALPVGAALMTYSLLRGEDMRITARMTTLSGLALAVLATPFGTALKQMF